MNEKKPMTINDTGLTCPACLAAPGTPHSLACDDPEEFRRREFERLSAEYEAAQIAAQEAEERAAEARKALAAAAKRAHFCAGVPDVCGQSEPVVFHFHGRRPLYAYFSARRPRASFGPAR